MDAAAAARFQHILSQSRWSQCCLFFFPCYTHAQKTHDVFIMLLLPSHCVAVIAFCILKVRNKFALSRQLSFVTSYENTHRQTHNHMKRLWQRTCWPEVKTKVNKTSAGFCLHWPNVSYAQSVINKSFVNLVVAFFFVPSELELSSAVLMNLKTWIVLC